jgi:ketosteroid isomerase-like protein
VPKRSALAAFYDPVVARQEDAVSNLATVQGIYEAFAKGDIPAILDVLAEDVEWEAWADNSAMEGGDQVAVELVLEANLPAWSGGHYRDEEMHLWTFNEDGNVRRLRHYTDTAKHIAAVQH